MALALLTACPAWAAAEDEELYSRVEVLLTAASTLSPAARLAMMSEAASIWKQHGVIIDWLPPATVRPVASNRMRVLIVERGLASDKGTEPVAVGELVRPATGHPVALISINGAQQLVSSVRGRAGYALITVDQRRLGVVLGRALAHEIGHYLLDTHTHAQSGLMRPSFNALEFTDSRTSLFALDSAAVSWLRNRREAKFAYAHH